jgi:hypothetical protein
MAERGSPLRGLPARRQASPQRRRRSRLAPRGCRAGAPRPGPAFASPSNAGARSTALLARRSTRVAVRRASGHRRERCRPAAPLMRRSPARRHISPITVVQIPPTVHVCRQVGEREYSEPALQPCLPYACNPPEAEASSAGSGNGDTSLSSWGRQRSRRRSLGPETATARSYSAVRAWPGW